MIITWKKVTCQHPPGPAQTFSEKCREQWEGQDILIPHYCNGEPALPVARVRKDTITQDKKSYFALCRNETVPCSKYFLPLEAWVLQNGDKTGFALEKDNENQPAGPLGEGCQCYKLLSWVTSSPSSTKAWKQQNRAWYAPTVTITLVIGSRSRPSSFSKNWARTFTRGGWPCGVRGGWELCCRRPLNQG